MPQRSPEELRTALLDQLAYLIDEIEALKPVIDQVPDGLQQVKADATGLSLRETYGFIAAYDEQVVVPHLERLLEEKHPVLAAVDAEALIADARFNEQSAEVLLREVQRARQDLLEVLRRLSAEDWKRTGMLGGEPHDVYALTHALIQHDADLLRAIGYHLEALMPGRGPAKH